MMKRQFAMISKKQFTNDFANTTVTYSDIKKPTRATRHSAGYDFYSPIAFTLEVGETIKVPTGIKVYVHDDEYLGIHVRSSFGFKYNVRLMNSTGIIDADYVDNPANEGHIWIALYNGGTKPLTVEAGDAFAQGIFVKFLLCDDDESNADRAGGFGSTSA